MKKLAELVIGNMKIENGMYDSYGSPTLFITYNDDKQAKNCFRRGYYQARCVRCGAMFTVKPYSVWYSHKTVTCPACGRVHTGNAVMYGDNPDSMLPDNTVMKVIDFKDRVELRIKYTAMCFGRFAYKTFKYLFNVKETYVFDIKNGKCVWIKSQGGKQLEKAEIGYLSDFLNLKEKTALWFYSFDHKINKGCSFTELLKALRTAVNKKMKAGGKSAKPLYIGGRFKNKLYGNVLNLAHKVRFWDSENVPALAYGKWAVTDWNNKVLGTCYLPKRFEEQVYLAMQKSDFISAICKVLKIPNIPHTRRNLQNENLAILHECYKIKNVNAAQEMFKFAKQVGLVGMETIRNIVEFYNTFIKFYPKFQIGQLIKKWECEYYDTLHLWNIADKVTKSKFYQTLPALSQLHDWLSLEVAKQDGREIIFDVPDEVINRYTMLMKAFGAKCIEKNSELKYWALSLSNCAAGYEKRINKERQLVGISDNRGKPVALLEINHNCIKQAKLFDNDPVYYKSKINAVVLEFAARCGLEIDTNDVLKADEERKPVMAIA